MKKISNFSKCNSNTIHQEKSTFSDYLKTYLTLIIIFAIIIFVLKPQTYTLTNYMMAVLALSTFFFILYFIGSFMSDDDTASTKKPSTKQESIISKSNNPIMTKSLERLQETSATSHLETDSKSKSAKNKKESYKHQSYINQTKLSFKIKTYKVAGISYRINNILKLASNNPDYSMTKKEIINSRMEDERIYQYEFFISKVDLVPEPDNPHDPNAIKVVADNVHIGYIKAGTAKHILNVINGNRIKSIDCEIYGGKYKKVYYADYDKFDYVMDRGESSFGAKLTVEEWEKLN